MGFGRFVLNLVTFDWHYALRHKLVMLKLLVLITTAATALFIVSCTSRTAKVQDEAAIRDSVNGAFKSLAEAAKSLDSEKYLSHFDRRKFTSLNEDGTVTHSFDEFAKVYVKQTESIAKYKSLEFDDVKITVVNESTAILVNTYIADVLLKSGQSVTASGAGTQVWTKNGDFWKLVSVSSSAR
jgi:hypothetical protein